MFVGCLALGPTSINVCSGAGALTLTYRGKVRLSEGEAIAKDQNGTTFSITGLSGIAYLGNDTYIAVMDNSNHLVALGVAFDKDGKIIEHKILGGDTIADSRDYEGVAFTNPQRNSVFLSDEAAPKSTQKIYEYSLGRSGKLLQSIDLPPVFGTQFPIVDWNRSRVAPTARKCGPPTRRPSNPMVRCRAIRPARQCGCSDSPSAITR